MVQMQSRRTAAEWRCDPEAAAQFAGRHDRFKRGIDLGADSSGVLAERDAGLRQRGTAGCPREKLDAEFGFQPEQPPTDDGLRDAKAPGSR